MDKLRELLLTFDDEDKNELRFFLNRHRHVQERKDGILLKLLIDTEMTSDEMIMKIYNDPSKKDAYHTLRKRLFRQLTHFVMLRRMGETGSNHAKIMGNFNLAQFLFERDSHDLAWKYLFKAEQDGVKHDAFNLLHEIYSIQLSHFETTSKIELEEIIEKLEANKILKEEDERFNIASSLVRKLYLDFKTRKDGFDLEAEIQQIISDYDLENAFVKRPKFLFQMIQMIRKGKMTKKEFYSFEPFVIKNYDRIVAKKGFRKEHFDYQSGILYVIAHTLFRNKQFEDSLNYTNELLALCEKNASAKSKKMGHKVSLLKAANLVYENQLDEALEELEQLLSQRIDETISLTAKMNKCVYLHFQNRFKEGNKVLIHIPYTDKEIERLMGTEFVLKKILLEIVFQFDLGNYEIVINKVRNLHRSFAEVFKQPMYARVKEFINCIKTMAMDSTILGDKDIWEKMDEKFQAQPFEEEDLQAMTYYAWLRSRMNKLPFYDALLEHIKNQGQLDYVDVMRGGR